jgi:hypothetical protein
MKDRYVILSGKLLALLREYYKTERPRGIYLFPSKSDPNKAVPETGVLLPTQSSWAGKSDFFLFFTPGDRTSITTRIFIASCRVEL